MELPTAQWPAVKAWPSNELADEVLSALRAALVVAGSEMPDGDVDAEAEEEEEAAEADAEEAIVLVGAAAAGPGLQPDQLEVAFERLTAAARSLREPFTPSATKLAPVSASFARALSAFMAAAESRVVAVTFAAEHFRSPGKSSAPLGQMRHAALGIEGVCAALATFQARGREGRMRQGEEGVRIVRQAVRADR